MKKLFFLTVLCGIILLPKISVATSGACSYHNGVNCGRGWQDDGRVFCNDGWDESTTFYDFTKKCNQNNEPSEMSEYILAERTVVGYSLDFNEEYTKCFATPSNERYIDRINSCTNYAYKASSVYYCPNNSRKKSDIKLNKFRCVCDEGYYSSDGKSCTFGQHLTDLDKMDILIKRAREINDSIKNNTSDTIKPLTNNQICVDKFGDHFKWDNNKDDFVCICESGYKLNESNNGCVMDDDTNCKKDYGPHSYWIGQDRECGCTDGYQWEEKNKQCIKKSVCNYPNILEDGTCLTPNEICTKHYGPNSYFNGNYNETSQIICDCQNGYEWKDNNECVLPKPATQPTKHDAKPVIINQPKTEDIKLKPKVQTELMSKVQTNNQKQPTSTENAPSIKQTSRASDFFHGVFQIIKSLFLKR